MLPSLEIRGFRCFRELSIAPLGRINLIVGNNGVGKTALLEALRLHAAQGEALAELWRILETRSEFAMMRASQERHRQVVDWPRAFYEPHVHTHEASISVGSRVGARDSVQLQLELSSLALLGARGWMGLSIGGASVSISLETADLAHPLAAPPRACMYLDHNGLSSEDCVRIWEALPRDERSALILPALRLVAPDIHKIKMGEIPGPAGHGARVPQVTRGSHPGSEPLHGLGSGAKRLFDIALGLTCARGGVFLLDEFENSLHPSVQPLLWRYLFDVALADDVQVFVTTHSWDCIHSFYAAGIDHPGVGAVLRLERGEGAFSDVHVEHFSDSDVAVFMEQAIDLR